MLSQLVYVSTRKENCTDGEIDKILKASNSNNGKVDVTGVLLYSENKFLQVLEGDKNKILGLFDHIKKDSRHKKVVLISLSPASSRYFPSWQMGSKKMDISDISFLTNMTVQEKNEFQKLLAGVGNNSAPRLIKKLI